MKEKGFIIDASFTVSRVNGVSIYTRKQQGDKIQHHSHGTPTLESGLELLAREAQPGTRIRVVSYSTHELPPERGNIRGRANIKMVINGQEKVVTALGTTQEHALVNAVLQRGIEEL